MSRDFVQVLRSLAQQQRKNHLDLLGRVSGVLQKSARTPLPRAGGRELVERWLDVNLSVSSLLVEYGSAFLNDALSVVERNLEGTPARATAGAQAAPGPAAEVPRTEIEVRGAPGETVSAPFLVENHYLHPLEVTPLARSVSGDEAALAESAVHFRPASLQLSPASQGVLQAVVEVPEDLTPGTSHRLEVELEGFEDRRVGLALTVLPPSGADPAATQPAKSAKTAVAKATPEAPGRASKMRKPGARGSASGRRKTARKPSQKT